jgi:hypothetical protein
MIRCSSMAKVVLLIIAFAMLSAAVLAVKPTPVVQISTGGLQIEYPKLQYIVQGSRTNLNFHVYNSSNKAVYNTSTKCHLHLYNSTGQHIVESTLVMDSNQEDFKYSLGPNLTGKPQMLPFIMYCNKSGEQGYLSSTYEITRAGQDPSLQTGEGMTVVVFMLALVFGLFFLSYTVGGAEIHNTQGEFSATKRLVWKLLRKGIRLAAIGLFALTTVMVGQISQASNLGMSKEFFTIMWLVTRVLMIAFGYFMLEFLFKGIQLLREAGRNRRFGDD